MPSCKRSCSKGRMSLKRRLTPKGCIEKNEAETHTKDFKDATLKVPYHTDKTPLRG